MSPYAGGFRSLVLAAALEFNFLKALIVFLALLVVPALLVGIALALLLTYGSLLQRSLAATNGSPVPALVAIALLMGFAIFAGRPLLRVGFDNLRQVHYTLVFPVFVALRELLRMIAERLHGRSISLEQLNRGRRIGAIAAALIFASGGLALAWGIWSSFGFQFLSLGHLHPWALAKSALVNAAIVFGISTIIDSLLWLHQELTIGSQILNWMPDQLHGEQSRAVRIAHLSDLHLVGERYGYRMETGTHGPRGNRCMVRALRTLTELQASAPLDRVLITGDITDAGTRSEWAEFIDLLRSGHGLEEPLSFIPGNHDTNVVDRTNAGRLDLPWSSSHSLRKLRTLVALDMVQGKRTYVVDRSTGKIDRSLSEYLRDGDRSELLRSLAAHGTLRGRWELEKIWDAVFPLVEPAEGNRAYGVILLDSNARTHLSLTNAIGFISPAQLRALKSVLRSYPRCPWIIALHHQVVEYPVASVSLRDRVGLALVNAYDFLAAIRPYARQIAVLHGHRHTDWIGMYGDVVLCSAPSVVFGSQSDPERRGSFRVYEFGLAGDGSILLKNSERVYIDPRSTPGRETETGQSDRAA
jgi:3',5'-cyclic AMP phosphodiesterase CpdA